MICTPCIILAIIVAAVLAAVLLLALPLVRTVLGILLPAALIAVAGLCVYVNEGARIGVALGLLFGTILGPVRLAGVDFRQWFMDPGTPSELGDDSFIGLIRRGFHALWIPALAANIGMLCTVSLWLPPDCRLADVPPALQALSGTAYLHWLGNLLTDLVSACAGFYAAVNVVLGMLLGMCAGPALVELVWRFGLVRGIPSAGRVQVHLAPQALPRVRPKQRFDGYRRLIICCDGTWNWPESKRETNVVRMVRSLKPDDNGVAQIIHYHQGVGTGNFLDRLVGGGAGVGLSASVKACYGFLVDNYREGDEIFLFGFSRGAFVVRALGGVIGEIGMMRKAEMASFSEVWNWYCQGKDVRDATKEETLGVLAPERCQHVDIECIGVWDTVGALGIPGTRFCAQTYEFHDTSLGAHVRHAFQALAIDERRGNFQGAVWVPYDPVRRRRRTRNPQTFSDSHDQAEHRRHAEQQGDVQVLEQMWFPGVHSNVGGGYPQHGLSDTTFIWMLDKLQGKLGFDAANIASTLDDVDAEECPRGKLEDSRTLFWKLIACPVPRPVGIISATERVHGSTWERSESPEVPGNDIYKSARRGGWLGAIGLCPPARIGLGTPRTRRELDMAAATRTPAPQLPNAIRPKLGVCGQLIKLINPEG
jgi:uncharacterized protein (DUF2235 family)